MKKKGLCINDAQDNDAQDHKLENVSKLCVELILFVIRFTLYINEDFIH